LRMDDEAMTRKTIQTTILFADITGSSQIYERLGDQAAQEVIGKVLTRLSDLTAQFEGSVIKTVGDEIISIFPSTDNAIEAAKAMQEAMTSGLLNAANLPPINIHIGLHYGSVVIDNKDIFGDAVNITARVVDYANPRQIVATKAAIDNLPKDSVHYSKYISSITAKNITGKIELFEIIFENLEMTMVLDSKQLSDALNSTLLLTFGDKVITVDSHKPVISIGRENYNDVVMKYSWISRTHAYVEDRNGLFMVKDKSTNGTYIYPHGSDPIYVNKGEHPLGGKGVIIFGREMGNDTDSDSSDTLKYSVK